MKHATYPKAKKKIVVAGRIAETCIHRLDSVNSVPMTIFPHGSGQFSFYSPIHVQEFRKQEMEDYRAGVVCRGGIKQVEINCPKCG